MHASNAMNGYLPEEIQNLQEQVIEIMVEAVQNDAGIPTFRSIADKLQVPVLVITRIIKKDPVLYQLIEDARSALANEVEHRLFELARGRLSEEYTDDKGNPGWFVRMDKIEMDAAGLLLKTNDPAYAAKPTKVVINNPRVPVGEKGRQLALSGAQELAEIFNQV